MTDFIGVSQDEHASSAADAWNESIVYTLDLGPWDICVDFEPCDHDKALVGLPWKWMVRAHHFEGWKSYVVIEKGRAATAEEAKRVAVRTARGISMATKWNGPRPTASDNIADRERRWREMHEKPETTK